MSQRPRETLEEFRRRARAWLAAHMPPRPVEFNYGDWNRQRELQRTLFEGGFAGICFPEEYGGLGLPFAYQEAFTEESMDYEMPLALNSPTLGIIAGTLLDFGSDEQKRRFIPRILTGEDIWVQFLSEPTSGSDLASVTTRATRDGDHFVVNGSKIWSSGAHAADWAICVTRSDWSVPKHDGITVLLMEIDQPGVSIERIVDSVGGDEFCQEFFDDVRVPVENVLGEPEQGWTVVRGLLAHERTTAGGGSIYTSGRSPRLNTKTQSGVLELAQETGTTGRGEVRQLIGEDYTLRFVQNATSVRVMRGIGTGKLPPAASALLRLMGAQVPVRRTDMALETAGAAAVAWRPEDLASRAGAGAIARQQPAIGGGTTEMALNLISEQLLGMPREPAADRGVPFDRVRHNTAPRRKG